MNKITLFFLLLLSQTIFAQFATSDVAYYVGSGSKTAYLVVDFNDDFSPNSYVWGYRFEASNLTMEDMINAIANDEPFFNATIPNGYLYQLSYNHHAPSTDDDWSFWTGTASDNMNTNNGVGSEIVVDQMWYGLSYGYPEEFDYEPIHPKEPIAAYSSQLFNASQITNWIGTGANQSLVVVDFGTNTNNVANSFVYGIKYNGSISAIQALQLIQDQTTYFNFTTSENQIATLNLASLTGEATLVNPWRIYEGTDFSKWEISDNLDEVSLSNGEWLGLSFSSRRPFTPIEATDALLSNPKNKKVEFTVYPNPTSDYLNIEGDNQIQEITIFNLQGKQILKTNEKTIDVSGFNSGMYLLEIKTTTGSNVVKFIKK